MPKCGAIGPYGQNQALWAHVWAENGPKTAHTPRLARNAPFAHLGACRGRQSVVLSVHMPKTRHSGRMFGRKTARKRPVTRPNQRDRILIRVRPSYPDTKFSARVHVPVQYELVVQYPPAQYHVCSPWYGCAYTYVYGHTV